MTLPTSEIGDAPVVPILFLGDPGIGKSTLLSRLAVGHAYTKPLPSLHDLDEPHVFNIRLYDRPYRFELYDTASPTNYTLLRPSVIVMCYSIADPASLYNLKTRWNYEVEEHFNHDESIPVIVLGLQRDVRNKEDYDGRVRRSEPILEGEKEMDSAPLNARTFVYPQEGLRVAQELRSDRYCECSALTGELCREVIEDISRTAAKTTTEKGGRSDGTHCVMM
ncbi:related to transforming rho [Lecanosticta acicola]|uniref:Related to transforming rho n=1 Tax=Lecanosticta acicola TaxID=111012 RepID=A0AAI8YR71_9PEZI|nr:related to transforming rho [Lecanosticta acicola]